MPSPTSHTLLDSDASIARLPELFRDADPIAADTEFNRTNTYRPELCLVQLATDGELALVDMLAAIEPTPLLELLTQTPGVKLFHAASQDMEALQLNLGVLPNRVFDTQIAAGLLGYPAQIGYATLSAEILGVQLDKAATRTDWSRRPLSASQLHYAAEDVTHLFALYADLRDRLVAAGRYAWAEEDSARLLNPARYQADPENAWQRLGGVAYLPVDVQARARALAAWRERRAMRINRPRQWVLQDKALMNIAHADPADTAMLTATEGLPPAIARRQGERIIAVLRDANAGAGRQDLEQRCRPATPDRAAVKRLAQLVTETATALDVAPELLATRREITGLLRGDLDQRVMSGWRRDVLGETLLAAL
ncbi:MAG: ribonuclease D [Gammaproteobacteria bacterium]|nr:ribonuclease D [Gammaproteobacteria bacterium]